MARGVVSTPRSGPLPGLAIGLLIVFSCLVPLSSASSKRGHNLSPSSSWSSASSSGDTLAASIRSSSSSSGGGGGSSSSSSDSSSSGKWNGWPSSGSSSSDSSSWSPSTAHTKPVHAEIPPGTHIRCTSDGTAKSFTVDAFLASGLRGDVYGLTDGKHVAKFVRENIKEQFKKTTVMGPTGYVVCTGTIKSPQRLDFMVMKKLHKCERPLTDADFRQLFDQLKQFERAGYSHKDVHQNQIMCTDDGLVTFVDFGQAERRKGLDGDLQVLIMKVIGAQTYKPEGASTAISPYKFVDEFEKRWYSHRRRPDDADALFALALQVAAETKAHFDQAAAAVPTVNRKNKKNKKE